MKKEGEDNKHVIYLRKKGFLLFRKQKSLFFSFLEVLSIYLSLYILYTHSILLSFSLGVMSDTQQNGEKFASYKKKWGFGERGLVLQSGSR